MNQDARQDSAVRAPGDQNPAPKGITPTRKDLGSDSPYDPYCACGHEQPNHRHGRCWIGYDGNPVYRAKSTIACPCTGWEPTP